MTHCEFDASESTFDVDSGIEQEEERDEKVARTGEREVVEKEPPVLEWSASGLGHGSS